MTLSEHQLLFCPERHLARQRADAVGGEQAEKMMAHVDEGPRELESIPQFKIHGKVLSKDTSDVVRLIEHYERNRHQILRHVKSSEIEFSRLRDICGLRPDRWATGEEGWLGFTIFEFHRYKKAVLECPVSGNATYILRGKWGKLLGHSRKHLRTYYEGELCTRVFHSAQWLAKVKERLNGKGW